MNDRMDGYSPDYGIPPSKTIDEQENLFSQKASLAAIEYALDGFLSAGTTYIAGGHGVGKSNMLVPLASIVAGELFSDIDAELQRKVLFVTEDVDQARRVRYGLKKHCGLVESGNFAILKAYRRTAEEVKEFILWAEKHHTVTGPNGYRVRPLIVWDTTNACFKVENENDASAVGEFMDALKTGWCNWIVGHLAKAIVRTDFDAMTGRGSSAWEADAQCTAFIFTNDETTNIRHIGTKKVRFEPTCRELKFESHIDRETVQTPWGTTQVVPFRYGVPVRSSPEEREAIVAKIKESKNRIQLTKDIGTVKTFMWGKPAMSSAFIETSLKGEVTRANVRAALKEMAQRGEVVGDCDYVSEDGKNRKGGIVLKTPQPQEAWNA